MDGAITLFKISKTNVNYMKIRESNEREMEFKPFEITLTIESKRELQTLWCIFNASPVHIADFLNNVGKSGKNIPDFTSYEMNGQNRSEIYNFLNEKLK